LLSGEAINTSSLSYSSGDFGGKDTVNLHFGAVSAIDFKVTPPVTDGTADAVILAGRNKFIVDSHVAARAYRSRSSHIEYEGHHRFCL